MKIIILKKINNIKDIGSIIDVKNGYALNYLIPYGYALIANKDNINNINKKIEEKNKIIEYNNNYYKYIKNELLNIDIITIKARSKNNKLFGSIKKIDIINYIKNINKNINLNKNNIFMFNNIKNIGKYKIKIKINNSFIDLNINVISV